MPATERVSHFNISFDGTPLTAEEENAVVSVVVDLTLDIPGMAVVDLMDPLVELVDSSSFDIGKEIKIGMEVDRDESTHEENNLFVGEITSIEPVFDANGETRMRIRAYDKSHRLHRSQESRAFLQVTDSDIVSQLASAAGVPVSSVKSTTVVHEHVYQFQQTDFDFMRERARRNGFVMVMKDGRLFWGPPDEAGTAGPTLAYGVELQEFRPRMTTSGQVPEVTVKGWDRTAKSAIVASASSPSFAYRGGSPGPGGGIARAKFAAKGLTIRALPSWTQAEAEAVARAVLDEREAAFMQGDGRCLGHPGLKAATRVTLEGLGTRFSGEYFVTRATHRLDRNGYVTDISLAGLRTATAFELLGGLPGLTVDRSFRFPGVVPAIVTNTRDPDKLGRVKVKFPSIADDLEGRWVPVAQPVAGADRGYWLIPEPNEEVLIAFEYGDFDRPYVIGSLWNGKDSPPADASSATEPESIYVLQSNKKSKFIIDGNSGSEKIEISTSDGHKILIDKTNKKIEVTTGGGIKMTLDDMAKQMNLEGAAVVNVKSSGPVNVKGDGPVSVESSAPVNIKGAIVNIN